MLQSRPRLPSLPLPVSPLLPTLPLLPVPPIPPCPPSPSFPSPLPCSPQGVSPKESDKVGEYIINNLAVPRARGQPQRGRDIESDFNECRTINLNGREIKGQNPAWLIGDLGLTQIVIPRGRPLEGEGGGSYIFISGHINPTNIYSKQYIKAQDSVNIPMKYSRVPHFSKLRG